jgi:hypothetical protein
MRTFNGLEKNTQWRIILGIVVVALFILSSLAVNKTVQALTQAAGYYGYYSGTYGYNGSTASSDYLPSAPTNFTKGATSANQVAFSWTAATTTTGSTSLDNGDGYTIAYGTSALNGDCSTGTLTGVSSGTTSATLTSLSAGTTYNIEVCTEDTNGNGSTALASTMTTSSSGGGGGGSSSSGSAAPAPDPVVAAPAETAEEGAAVVTAETTTAVSIGVPTPVSIGGATHTVNVASATATEATMTISSDPVTATFNVGIAKDIDTDGNGIDDLRVTYDGLNADGDPEFTFAALELPVTCSMPSGMGVSPINGAAQAITAVEAGNYIKSESFPTVYYVTPTCGRRAFMNEQTYFTWSPSFDRVVDVSDATLSALSLQGIMLPKHNVVLVKIQSDAKVYAVTRNSSDSYAPILRWVSTEDVANSLYGAAWADYVIDISAGLFPRFEVGTAILTSGDLDVDRNLLKRRVDL